MKQITLITSQKTHLSSELQKSGYTVTEYNSSQLNDGIIATINAHKSQYLVIELEDDKIDIIEGLTTNNRKTVCLAEKLTDKTKKLLYKKGIANFLPATDPKRVTNYLAALEGKHKQAIAPLLILESHVAIKTILKEIIERFNFKPLFISSCEEIYDTIRSHKNIQLLLINLGHPKLDVKKLILRAHTSIEIKKIPVITYKDMLEGLFVHELTAGLNRLTSYILSTDELFSVLTEMLFKKELYPLVQKLNAKTDFNKNELYTQSLLSQIFRQEDNLFTNMTLLTEKKLQEITRLTNQIKKASVKADGLNWLRMNYNISNNFTCEAGG